jgi:hypothetical protein
MTSNPPDIATSTGRRSARIGTINVNCFDTIELDELGT